ncbi:MAG: arylesterase [Beijerinckiaceae bacterium]|nr:arylesterase [Beijerinckiaceae bacterium]
MMGSPPSYAAALKLVAFGDSLTAGYQLPQDASFASQLEKALKAKGHDVEIIQGGVSGDTTADGLARLDWTVPADAKGVILELGANDAFRGVAPETIYKNLDTMITRLRARNVDVLLAGMYAPRNMGELYYKAFDGNYPALAKKHGIALYPFFLDGIAGDAKLNLPDGIHPTREGVAIIVQRMLPAVEAWIGGLK